MEQTLSAMPDAPEPNPLTSAGASSIKGAYAMRSSGPRASGTYPHHCERECSYKGNDKREHEVQEAYRRPKPPLDEQPAQVG